MLFNRGFFKGCKPFEKTFAEQREFISSIDWMDCEALRSIPSVSEEVFSESNGCSFPERRNAAIKLVESRIDGIDALFRSWVRFRCRS